MTIKVAIINYGIGNIRSLYNSLKKINVDAEIISDPELIYSLTKYFYLSRVIQRCNRKNTKNWLG